jgi:hypothetical protein
LDVGEGIDADPMYDHHYLPRISATIDFSAYKEYKLQPIKEVELVVPASDGSMDFSERMIYSKMVEDDWRIREGGILYALAEFGEFFSCMSHYHSHWNRIGVAGWDKLFENLLKSSYRKSIVPCMVSA